MGSVVEKLEKRNLKWHCHVIRMYNERDTKQAFEAQSEGRRRRGRLRNKWEQCIREITRDRGADLKRVEKMAWDGDQHRKWINSSTLKGDREK